MIYGYYIYFENIDECDLSECNQVERDLFKTPQKNLQKIVDNIKKDDVLIVPCLARLGNINFIYKVVEPIYEKGAKIYLNEEAVYIDQNFINHLTMFNKSYKQYVSYTRLAGIHKARKAGVYKARPHVIQKGGFNPHPKIEITDDFKELYKMWKNKDISARECMRRLGWKPDTFYRRVKEYEGR